MTERQLEEMGLRIRQRREDMNLTQERAAELLDISLTHYKNIEHGRATMSVCMLMTLCERFKLDHTYVLTGKNIGTNPILDFYDKLPENKREAFERMMYYMVEVMKK